MAWIDDRIWCHPKFTDLSAPAFRAYVNGVAYASGMSTRGHLTSEQQKLVGGTSKVRNELVRAQLWDENSNGIVVHDWEEHNGKRDERRAADRERKRLARAKERKTSAGTSAGQSRGTSAGTARVDGSEGSEGSEEEPFLPSYVDLHEEMEGRTELPIDVPDRPSSEADFAALPILDFDALKSIPE